MFNIKKGNHWETVLQLLAEGGSLTVVGKQIEAGAWVFQVVVDESVLEGMLDELEGMDLVSSTRYLEWSEVLENLDSSRWWHLHPKTVHPEFRDRIEAAIRARCATIADDENWYSKNAWETACGAKFGSRSGT